MISFILAAAFANTIPANFAVNLVKRDPHIARRGKGPPPSPVFPPRITDSDSDSESGRESDADDNPDPWYIPEISFREAYDILEPQDNIYQAPRLYPNGQVKEFPMPLPKSNEAIYQAWEDSYPLMVGRKWVDLGVWFLPPEMIPKALDWARQRGLLVENQDQDGKEAMNILCMGNDTGKEQDLAQVDWNEVFGRVPAEDWMAFRETVRQVAQVIDPGWQRQSNELDLHTLNAFDLGDDTRNDPSHEATTSAYLDAYMNADYQQPSQSDTEQPAGPFNDPQQVEPLDLRLPNSERYRELYGKGPVQVVLPPNGTVECDANEHRSADGTMCVRLGHDELR